MRGGDEMDKFLTVKDVMEILHCCQSKAYKVIRELNKELEREGQLYIAGRISAKRFKERFGC